MSNQVFPLSLPGVKMTLTRINAHRTSVLTAASGREFRARWWSSPLKRWKVSFEFLRQNKNNSNADELQTLVDFFDAHHGSWDSFLLDCPMDGNQYRVRFADDKLEVERFLDGYWEAKTIELVEVRA